MLGLLVAAVVLVHVPSSLDALNYFDPPKRLVWSVAAIFLACVLFRNRRSLPMGIHATVLLCLFWIAGRSLARGRPDVETEVLVTWLLPVLLFGVGLAVDMRRATRTLAWVLAVSGGVQVVLMLLQYFGNDPLFADTTATLAYRPARMIGTVGYQNQAADFLALSGAALFVLVRHHARRLLFLCLLLVAVGLTGNRGAIVGLLLSIPASHVLLAIAGGSNGRRGLRSSLVAALAVVPAVLAIILALEPATRQRFLDVFSDWDRVPALASRVTMARVALSMWVERPFFGWGAGEFAFQYLDRLSAMLPEEKTHAILGRLVFARETHNDYLQFGAEFGLVGSAIILVLFILMFRRAWKARSEQASAIASCLFVLTYMMAASLVSFPWQTSLAGPLAAFLLGALLPREQEAVVAVPGAPARWTALQTATRLIYLTLAVALLAWCSMDAHMNVRLPADLRSKDPLSLAASVPNRMHGHHAIVGAALAKTGEYAAALTELRHAHAGYRDIMLFNNMGHVLSRLGAWQEAVRVYRAWADTGIDHAKALGNLAIAYEQAGDFGAAASTLEKQRNLWPDDDLAAVQRLGALYLKAGNPPSALLVLRRHQEGRSSARDDLPAEFDNLTGAVLMTVGDLKAAEEKFLSALRKKPELISARRNLEQLRQNARGNAVSPPRKIGGE